MELEGKYAQWMYYALVLLAFAAEFSPAVTSIAIVFGILLVIVHRVHLHAWPKIDDRLWRVICCYFLLWAFIAMFSIEPLHSLREVFGEFYRTFPLFFVMMALKSKEHVKGIMLALSFSVLINDVVSMWQFWGMGIHRPPGMNNTPSFVAVHMVMVIPVLWWGANRELFSMVWRRLFLALCLISMVVLVITFTRGGWLAFFIVCLVYCLMAKSHRKKVLLGIAGVLLAFAIVMMVVPSVQQRFVSIVNVKTDTSNLERLYLWQSACEMVKDHPLVGVGPDEFGLAYNSQYILPQARHRRVNGDSGLGQAHNNLLHRFAEGGILGGMAFVMLYAYLLYRLILVHRQRENIEEESFALMGILVFTGLHVSGIVDANTTDVPIMREFWMLMGLSLVADDALEADHGVHVGG